ncbi:hypothetical protein N7522_005312 [Penicillium canescens]|nr:hypothetical protein N7522_005312 [Penicillium canescens]
MSDQPRGRGGRGRGPRGGDFGDRGGGRGGRGRGRGDFQGLLFALLIVGASEAKPITPPDATVVKTEDAVAKALVASRQKNATNAARAYPDRPGYGTLGRPVTLYANYLPFTSVGKPIYRYHVSIAAEGGREPAGRKERHIVRLLLEEHYSANLNGIATDYRSTLISVTELAEGQFDVRYKDENDEEYPENPKVYRVTIQHTGHINPADLINYLTSTNAGSMLSSKPEIVQVLNVILGHHPKTERSVTSIGGNRHYTFQEGIKESASLEGGLEVLRGFFVRASSYRMEAFLKRMRVCITHIKRKGKNGKERPARVKTISGLATPQDGGSAPNGPKVDGYGAGPHSAKFFLDAPGSQSPQPGSGEGKGKKGKKAPPKAGPPLASKYNITVNPDLPVVNVGTRDKPVYLLVDIERSRKLPTCRMPAKNAESIVTKGTCLASSPDYVCQAERSPGQIWQLEHAIHWVLQTCYIEELGLAFSSTPLTADTVSLHRGHWSLDEFVRTLKSMGVAAEKPKGGTRIEYAFNADNSLAIEKAVRFLQEKHGSSLSAILFAKDAQVCTWVKKVCDVRCGVRNVNVQAEKVREADVQYWGNVGLKINLKMGGANLNLRTSDLVFADGKTMLVGLDSPIPPRFHCAAHPVWSGSSPQSTRNSHSGPQIFAFSLRAREMVSDLDILLQSRIKIWAKRNKGSSRTYRRSP